MSQYSAAGAKSELRQRLIQARNLRHISKDEAVDVGLTRNLIELCVEREAKTVAAYLSFGTEPSTLGFLDWAKLHEIEVLLPISLRDGELEWVRSSGEETVSGIFGFAEAVGQIANLADADLVLLPALAVDRQGIRLGKGKGYYDRALAGETGVPSFAVVYDSEVFDELPHEAHDVAVDGYVTESLIAKLSN